MATDEREEGKKYTVVDKRFDYMTDEEQVETPAAAEPVAPVATPDPEPADDDDSTAGQDAQESGAQEARMTDAILLALNMVRERSMLSLGLLMTGGKAPAPDFDQAGKLAGLFNRLVAEFKNVLPAEALAEGDRPIPTAEEMVITCFNILQGHIFLHMGLLANPVTGLLVKDMPQAKLGIDFLNSLMVEAGDMISPPIAAKLAEVIADFKLNYVNQLGMGGGIQA